MAREAMITINCERYSKKVIDIINAFSNAGWTYYNKNNMVHYLPLGDNDDFYWNEDDLSEKRLYDLIECKQVRNELIGLDMYYENSDIGITVLARDTKEINLNLDINRKTIENSRESFTDVGWYFSYILIKLKESGCLIDDIRFEEYTD